MSDHIFGGATRVQNVRIANPESNRAYEVKKFICLDEDSFESNFVAYLFCCCFFSFKMIYLIVVVFALTTLIIKLHIKVLH